MNLSEIDFAQLYRERVARAGRPERPPEYWDGRVNNQGARMMDSEYVRAFIARMDFTGCETLLDVGCGPGSIALASFPRIRHAYGLDYSPIMLEVMMGHARTRGVADAVTPIRRAWDEDWSDVPECDLAVASRSTAVPDIEAAILKLNAKARRRVYLTYPVDGHLTAVEVCEAIGRPDRSLPDYLYVVGILHHLGIRPTLDYLPGENRFAKCANLDEFRAKAGDILGNLSAEEEAKLRAFWEANEARIREQKTTWALFGWSK